MPKPYSRQKMMPIESNLYAAHELGVIALLAHVNDDRNVNHKDLRNKNVGGWVQRRPAKHGLRLIVLLVVAAFTALVAVAARAEATANSTGSSQVYELDLHYALSVTEDPF